jgi:hypothetical protein
MLIKWTYNTEELDKKEKELAESRKQRFKDEIDRQLQLNSLQRDLDDKKTQFLKNEEQDKGDSRSVKELTDAREALQKEAMANARVIEDERARQLNLDKQKPKSVAQTQREAAAGISQFGLVLDEVMDTGFSGETYHASEQRKALQKRAIDDKERQSQVQKSKQAEEDAIHRLNLATDQRMALDKKIIDQKAAEERKANGEARAQSLKDAEERQNRLDAELKDRISKQKGFASQLASEISGIDPKFAEQESLDKKRAEIEQARKDQIITEQQRNTLLSGLTMKPDAPAGNAAAVKYGSQEAYSAILRAMKTTEQNKIQQDQKKIQEESKLLLREIRDEIRNQEEQLGLLTF